MGKANRKGTDPSAISHRITVTWIQTVLAISLLATLTGGTIWLLGFHWSFAVIALGIWVSVPLIGWYFSGTLVRKLMRCHEPDPLDPEHARLVRIVDALYPKTGLKVKPPVLISPLPVPNAFATGRSPSKSFIACTEGLFDVGLTDAELEAIVAHELAHVKSRDVAITSMTAVLSSIFSLMLAQGIPGLFNSVFTPEDKDPLLDKLEQKVTKQKRRFVGTGGGIAGFILIVLVFYIVNIFSKLITLFVSRCRESHADALAALWTNNPCALSSGLQKIVLWMTFNGSDIRMKMIMRGLTPVLFVSPFDEDPETEKEGVGQRLRRWWRRLGENHPPIPERLKMLDQMSGTTCPRLL